MKVNGKPISLFGARLLDYTISGTPLTHYTSDLMRYAIPNKYKTKTANKTITIMLVFKATWIPALHYRPSIQERLRKVTEQITDFDAELLKNNRVTIELPNGYTYLCTPSTLATAEDDGTAVCDSTYVFSGVQVMPMITVHPLNAAINCRSNAETDCVITITSKSALEAAAVFGITINNIKKGDVVVIDGIKKTVLCNGINKFADVDLTQFPTLQPGKNTFIVFPANYLDVTVSYYPTYI